MEKNQNGLLLTILIIVLSFNLRGPITSVGALMGLIDQDLSLSYTLGGLLTTIPLIAFALSSPFISDFGIKFGYTRVVVASLIMIIAGELLRLWAGIGGLFLGTAVLGVGISVGNVLIPSIIKLRFQNRLGLVTGIYIMGMTLFSALTTGGSIYVAGRLGLGWKNTLGLWIAVGAITLALWLYQLLGKKDPLIDHKDRRSFFEKRNIFKSPIMWAITVFMGSQSLLFYTYMTWIPNIVELKGHSLEFGGIMISTIQLLGLPASFLVPMIATRIKDQRWVAVGVAAFYLAGSIGIALADSKAVLLASAGVISVGSSGCYSAAIILMELKSRSSQTVAVVSGLSQSIGYLLASVGPAALGYLFDRTQSYQMPMALLILVSCTLALSGAIAGQKGFIRD